MSWMDLHDPAVGAEVVAVATRMAERLGGITSEIRDDIQDLVPALRDEDERVNTLLAASVQENVNTILHVLQHEIPGTVAPNAAVAYAQRLAQHDVPMSPLLRAYRLGQTRFQREFIAELLRERQTDHVEGAAAEVMVERVSAYVDTVVEQVVDAYQKARDEWLSHRSAILAQCVRTVLREGDVTADDVQVLLGQYRLAQHHVGAIVWCESAQAGPNALSLLKRLAGSLADAAACIDRPLFIPCDESCAWVWLPLGERTTIEQRSLEAVADETVERVSVALGEALPTLTGFRQSHRQALLAHSVAVAAKPPLSRLTAFADVAPVAMMCSDLDAARTWVAETLGALAMDDERCSLLRETARVFLESGGSFTATANQMILHRNTAQYRIRKAEDLRGRPLRDGRLDVELALLACHHLGQAVLQPAQPDVARALLPDRLEQQLAPTHK
jgi:PucR C-terminal helix-turn-helix domain/GGDEF-like domain